MNPYSHTNLFTFFKVFFLRILSGDIFNIAPDEIQIVTLSLLTLSCALVGTFLVLRSMTMLANALSHTLLLGIIGSFLLFSTFDSFNEMKTLSLFIASLLAASITALFTEFLVKKIKLQEDASIGLVFTFLFAVSIILVTLFTKNQHIGLDMVMGNVDALKKEDCVLVFRVFILNLVTFLIFSKEFKVTTFDAGLSKALGFSPLLFNLLLMFLTAITSVAAFRAVGVVMVLAFLVLPPLTSRLFANTLRSCVLLAASIGVIASIFGVALSRHLLTVYDLPLSTGALVVTLLGIIYALALTFRRLSLYYPFFPKRS